MAIIPGSAKVLNQYENVNTTYGGSKAMKAQSKWYTMQDVEDTINANKPYTVFTALLTQSGGSNVLDISSGALTQGVTYYFGVLAEGEWDFSNVGGPVYPNTNSFIATSNDAPNSYGGQSIYYNTGAPVATVLENTIGNIWFNYEDVGSYGCQSNDLFIDSKTFISITPTGGGGTVSIVVDNVFTSVKYISPLNNALNQIDNGLFNTPIEIRVYN